MKKKLKTGIGLFAYNRPSHLKRVLISLENFKLENIIVFLDGPKNENEAIIQENILFILKNSKIHNLKIIKQKKNIGLCKSLTNGINYLSKNYDFFIVLEDDCIPYRNFFKYFDICFKKYEFDMEINSICSFQFKELADNKQNVLKFMKLDHFIPWGWGSWSYKWKRYLKDKNKKYKNYPSFMDKFNNIRYRKDKKKDIWSLNYILYQYTYSLKSIFPNISLVKNIGFDGTGVNSKYSSLFLTKEQLIKKIDKNSDLYSSKMSNKQKKILSNKIELFF